MTIITKMRVNFLKVIQISFVGISVPEKFYKDCADRYLKKIFADVYIGMHQKN